LETTISLLDAALEKTPMVKFESTGMAYVIIPNTEYEDELEPLVEEYRKLHDTWKKWLRAVQDGV